MDEQQRERIVREFPVELSESGDGRTVEALVVPYGKPALVSDGGDPYEEEWVFGAFGKQTRAADKVKVFLNFEHEPGLRGIVGRASALEERQDGLHGTFRVMDNADGNKALELIRDGLLGGISLEAVTLRSVRENGVVKRLRAHLDRVSLCRFPAFPDARVLAVREGDPDPDEGDEAPPEDVPVPDEPDTETVEEPEPEPERVLEPVAARRGDIDELLARVGYEPIVRRAVVRSPWNGAASRFDDDQWRRSCILDRGDQFDTAKTRYALPVLEPNGDLNVNAMHAAAAVLAGGRGGVNAPQAAKAAAARKLRRFYGMAGEEMPPTMKAMATAA